MLTKLFFCHGGVFVQSWHWCYYYSPSTQDARRYYYPMSKTSSSSSSLDDDELMPTSVPQLPRSKCVSSGALSDVCLVAVAVAVAAERSNVFLGAGGVCSAFSPHLRS